MIMPCRAALQGISDRRAPASAREPDVGLASLKRPKMLFICGTSNAQWFGRWRAGPGRMTDRGFAMTSAKFDGQARADDDGQRALLAGAEGIAPHRGLAALLHELAGRLQQVVRFDFLGLYLHQAEGNILRLHVLEPPVASASAILP